MHFQQFFVCSLVIDGTAFPFGLLLDLAGTITINVTVGMFLNFRDFELQLGYILIDVT